MQENRRMEKERMKEQENDSTKRYLFLQAAIAVSAMAMILAGSLYFEKYKEEWITSLLVTGLLGIVYGRTLKAYLSHWKEILLLHVFTMLIITVGFLWDGFYKPIAFAPIIIGSFFSLEAGFAAALYYGVTAVLYTMETGELLMLYLLTAGVGISFLREFLASKSAAKKMVSIVVLFVLQTAGTILFHFYMYRETAVSAAGIGGAVLAVCTGIFSFVMPVVFSQEDSSIQSKISKKEESNKKDGKKREKKKTVQGNVWDENSELLNLLKTNQELYQHSLHVANIAERVAASVDADCVLVKLGAMYHDIGKLINGEDYVKEGVVLCQKHGVPEAVIDLVKEHNVNYRIPSSKEAAAVMLADTIVSTMEFNQKKGKETDPELLVEKIFKIRKEKGTLEASQLTEIELELMEEAMKKEVGVL